MKKNNKKNLYFATILILGFVLWTVPLCFIDVKAIGPNNSSVGFSTLNSFVHSITGVHFTLYMITDWLSLVPVAMCFFFAILGLIQWIRRKSFLKVDYSILVLGGFYIVVVSAYLFFEEFVINYRPVLINGYLEASYPSSTTVLVLCVMPTAIMQFNTRIKNHILRHSVNSLISAFIIFMVVARLISGVHWFSDIIGGVLLSSGLVMIYYYLSKLKTQ